jgi:hypothetical protein
MHDILVGVIAGLQIVGMLSGLVFGWQLQRFLSTTPSIDSWQAMERFKRVVAMQMYAALIQIGVLGLPGVLFVLGIMAGELRFLWDVLYLVVPAAGVVGVGFALKQIESRVRALPVSGDPEMQANFKHVVNTWINKPFPDW